MPSPFPGMDPYLEGSLWLSFHNQFCVGIAAQINPKLRPRYVAMTPERFVVDDFDDVMVTGPGPVLPDVSVLEPRAVFGESAPPFSIASAPLRLRTVMPARRKQVSVEIRRVENRKLVTAIELLSPTNKHGRGRKEYLRRRNKILASRAHLIEIDLLRVGHRVPMRSRLPAAPYYVFVSRAEFRPVTEVWPIQLSHPLPTIPVPLLEPDADVPLDLQQVMSAVYDTGSYDLLIDYSEAPRDPLAPDQATWAGELLRQHAAKTES